jgi:WD40 repeat protein
MAPYMLKERCPELPKHRVLRVVFEEDQVWLVRSNGRFVVAIDKKANAKVIVDESGTYKIHAHRKALHKKTVTCLTWKNEREFGTASEDATAKIWSDKLECLKTIEYHTCRVSAIAFSK